MSAAPCTVNEQRLVGLFRELCLINSPAKAERDCADAVKSQLARLGLDVQEDDAGKAIGGNAGNIIATLKGALPGAPRIFLSAHMDTVEPTDGLAFQEREGVFSSASDTILGADDKCGVAAALEAIASLIDSGEPHGDVVLLISVAEEIGLLGAAHLKIEDLGLDYGFVLDTGPPVGSFVNRTATHDMLNAVILGKPAHAGKEPELGISAIQVFADAVSQMKLGRIGPETTANIGVVHGGTATNVVCPALKLYGEARSTVLAELEAQVSHMKEVLELTARKWGAEVVIEHERHYSAYLVDEDSPVVKTALAASRSLGLEPFLRTTLGGSDANIYNGKGVPCVVVGTGMEKIHTHDEFITRENLVRTAEMALALVRCAAGSA